jgi:hypothetical protein
VDGSSVNPGDVEGVWPVFSTDRYHDRISLENRTMPAVEEESAIPDELVAEFEEAVDRLIERDP